jgi:hypothetical protein
VRANSDKAGWRYSTMPVYSSSLINLIVSVPFLPFVSSRLEGDIPIHIGQRHRQRGRPVAHCAYNATRKRTRTGEGSRAHTVHSACADIKSAAGHRQAGAAADGVGIRTGAIRTAKIYCSYCGRPPFAETH